MNFFKNCVFPAVIMEWNNLNANIQNSVSCNIFKKVIPKFLRPERNQILDIHGSLTVNFLTSIRLRLGC